MAQTRMNGGNEDDVFRPLYTLKALDMINLT